VPGKVHARNLAEPGGGQANFFKRAAIREKWPLPSSTLHNVMIFMICTMGMKVDLQDGCMWILQSGMHVDFEQWLGQVDARRPVHCAL